MTARTAKASPKKAPAAKQRGGREAAKIKQPDAVMQKELAKILSISDRRVQQLTAEGVLTRSGRFSYPVAENVARYVDFKVREATNKAAPSANSKLQERREEQLARRMAREDRDIIDLSEAMESFDSVTGTFLLTINGLAARLTRDVGERKRIEAILDNVRDELAKGFAKERTALQTGVPPSEALEEDDA